MCRTDPCRRADDGRERGEHQFWHFHALAYSLGLGIPFILAAIAIRPFLGFMGRFKHHLGTMEKVMGALLVLTGILFLTGSVNWIGQWILETFPGLGTIEDWLVPDDLQREIMRKSLEGSE